MEIKQLTENISVSGQFKHNDMADIAKLGFKTIINNRPDREVPDQPRTETLAAHATQAGLTYLYLPVISGDITQKNVDDFLGIFILCGSTDSLDQGGDHLTLARITKQ